MEMGLWPFGSLGALHMSIKTVPKSDVNLHIFSINVQRLFQLLFHSCVYCLLNFVDYIKELETDQANLPSAPNT